MEYKIDSYYGEELPYKLNASELKDQPRINEKNLLAFLRNYGSQNLRFKFYDKADICELLECQDSLHNPLVERDILKEGHWYHPYKIMFMNDEGYEKEWYFTDFTSCVREGHIKIWYSEDHRTFQQLEI